MKTKEELNTLKGELETVSAKLRELTDEEAAQVTGGTSRETEIEIYGMNYVNGLFKQYKERHLDPEDFKKKAESFMQKLSLDDRQRGRVQRMINAHYNTLKG